VGVTQEPSFSGLTYYKLLDLTPVASNEDIRQAYRQKSKLYHPDTTELPAEIATEWFRQLNRAYATLSNPEQRLLYDRQLGLESQELTPSNRKSSSRRTGRLPLGIANLDPKERPLSPGELFALFLMGVAFVGCLILALVVGMARGEMLLQDTQLPAFLRPITTLLLHKEAVEVLEPTQPQLTITEVNANDVFVPLQPSPMDLALEGQTAAGTSEQDITGDDSPTSPSYSAPSLLRLTPYIPNSQLLSSP
jgi:hypothetical protein